MKGKKAKRGILWSIMIWSAVPLINGGIPENRVLEWDAGVRGGIPEYEVKERISEGEIQEKGAEAIQGAIDKVRDRGVVELPAGEYLLKAPLEMRSGVVLRGAGKGKTELAFQLEPPEEDPGQLRPAFGAIRFWGSRGDSEYGLESGYEAGSRQLRLKGEGPMEAGSMILVYSENDPDLMYTQERWKADWAEQSIAQIVTVEKVTGKEIDIDTALRLDFQKSLNPRIRVIEPIEWAGLESMSIEGLAPYDDTIIGLENARNCWVRNVESAYTGRGHIWMNFSRFVTVTGNHVHHAYDYGGGGNGYGIVAGNIAVDCLVTNNELDNLRHSMMTKRGSNGNVFAYNYSHSRRREPAGKPLLCDISVHGHYSYMNLFEGNVVEFVELADYWGPTGPLTTLFRNRVKDRIKIDDHSHRTNIIGNDLIEGDIVIDPTCEEVLILGNRDAKLEKRQKKPALPASLYYDEAPEFWGDMPWPGIGPGTDASRKAQIPVQREDR